ncbi:prepilin-type N-terminal cleavage/methylation domain-containing protein [Pseudoxanthomonas sp.]|uniref:PilW family protein n=1 Tax=Pseudoxanthomonas sp. TaxID=1871049 RepID=UPI002586A097|nr:prepilin-type N-terminal cleavage/methylation domain-containing protein [Pseudoxanthomonas sp.]MCR6685678.1 prepilin-type N-terminal cleavage/methylation domain-containing protein [Pseudoxanthomonas sp.]
MRSPKVRQARQRGYTLISLMVGLVISLLTIAAMLAVYKMVVEVSGQASADSLRDGQVASGLLAAQIELHEAGYGVVELPELSDGETADASQIGLYAIAVDAADKRNVTWRSSEGCARLEIAPGNDRSVAVYYQKPEPCADIPSASWAEGKQVLVAYGQPWKERDGTAAANAASGTYLDMAADAGDSGFRIVNSDGERCTLPYAQQAQADSPTESPRIVLESGGRELFSTCLSNIVAMRKAGAPASGSGT